MKKISLLCFMSALIFLGAGCSKTTTVAVKPQTVKEPLIQRRTTQPPAAPEKVPLPTPVQPSSTGE